MWRDVTGECRAAASRLDVSSSMISTEDFSLLQSMCAVELMDPKMDQCYNMSLANASIEQLLKVQAPEGGLTPAMAIKIMHVLLSYEAAFVDGASLLESTHQCILLWEGSWAHFAQARGLPARAVLLYCKSLNVSLNRLCHGVAEADIFEDEDFQPLSTKKSFAADLLRGEGALIKEIHSLLETCDDDGAEMAEVARLLRCRVAMHDLCAKTDAYICHLLSSARTALPSVVGDEDQARHKAAVDTAASSAQKYLSQLISAPSSLPLPGLSYHSQLEAQDIAFAFSTPLVKIMQSSPIRHVSFVDFPQSASCLLRVCSELLAIGELIVEIESMHKAGQLTLDYLLRACVGCSQRRLHVVTRSVLLAALKRTSVHLEECILESMLSHGVPMSLLQYEPLSLLVSEVLTKVCWNTLRALTINRSKLLVKLDSLLAAWGGVVSDVHEVSVHFIVTHGLDDTQVWLQYWAMLQTTMLMDLFMAVSAESSLLGQNELDYFFWYWDFICNARVHAFERLRILRQSLQHQMYQIALEEYTQAKENEVLDQTGKSKGAGRSIEPPSKPTESAISIDELLQCTRGHLCKGVFRLLVAANQLRLVERRENKYTTWPWRFMQRFRAFQNILNPRMLSYDEFLHVLGIGAGGRDDDGGGEGEDGEEEDSRLESGKGIWTEDVADKSSSTPHRYEDSGENLDLPVCLKIICDAAQCFGNAKKLLADAKKTTPCGLPDQYLLELAGPLLKFSVASSVSALRTEQTVIAEGAAAVAEVTGSSSSSGKSSKKARVQIAHLSLSVDKSLSQQFPLVEIKTR